MNGEYWESVKEVANKAYQGDQKALEDFSGMLTGILLPTKAISTSSKLSDFSQTVPDSVNSGKNLPVVGKTKGYENQISVLFDELTNRGVKYSKDDIISISKLSSGKIVFLERGNDKAGLTHIINSHGDDFAKKGISKEHLPNILISALDRNKIVGFQGKGNGRPIYEIEVNGKKHHIGITVGSNGFIVGANPTTIKDK